MARVGGRSLLLLLLLVAALLVPPPVAARSALYNTTARRVPGKLNVHIISHTHNDPGWISSYTQYHRSLVLDGHVIGGVEAILDTATWALLDNPDRTFVYADLAFFVKWWQEAAEETRALVRRLVADGRWEFVNGGLVQHDEATAHYAGMVEQMGAGMGFLMREFGVAPRIAWQLDGFGHSRSEPLLKSMGGFDALFFGRSDVSDMEQRAKAHNLELMWRGSEGFGAESDLWVSQYPTGNYGPPSMSWFFERRNDYAKSLADFVRDDPEAHGEEFNVRQMVDLFVNKSREWQAGVRGDDVMFLMGSDFTHSDARSWFANVDKLIHYVNKDGRVNAFYSTPSAFVAAKRHLRPALALKTDDFFPYCGNNLGTDYWTGFFTSRPNLKAQVRRGWALLRALQQLEVLTELQPSSGAGTTGLLAASRGLVYAAGSDAASSEAARFGARLAPVHDGAALEFALATALHHDAITGTAKRNVSRDYEAWLAVAAGKAAPKVLQGLAVLLWPGRGINRLTAADAGAGAGAGAAAEEAADASSSSSSRSGGVTMPVGGIFRHRALLHKEKQLTASNSSSSGADEAVAALPELHMCLLLNATLCSASAALSQDAGFLLVVYNPLAWQYEWGVTVPVAPGRYAVFGPDDAPVAAQLLPLSDMTTELRERAAEAAPQGVRDVALDASQLLALQVSAPPLGHAAYRVVRLPDRPPPAAAAVEAAAGSSTVRVLSEGVGKKEAEEEEGSGEEAGEEDEQLELSNGPLTVTVSRAAGGIASIAFPVAGAAGAGTRGTDDADSAAAPAPTAATAAAAAAAQTATATARLNFTTSLARYAGDRLFGSGAYTQKAERPSDGLPPPLITVLQGPVLAEVRQAWPGLGELSTRLWRGSPRLEVVWTAAAPPPGVDWEVTVRYGSSLNSAGLWHTDANGREYQQRRRGYRPAFRLPNTTAHLPGDIYPVTTGVFLRGPPVMSSTPSSSSAAAAAEGAAGGGGAAAAAIGAATMHVAVDRAQGVASVEDGELELFVHRASARDDNKGMYEPLLDEAMAAGVHVVSFAAAAAAGGGGAGGAGSGRAALQQQQQHQQQLSLRAVEQALTDPLQLAFAALPPGGAISSSPSSSSSDDDDGAAASSSYARTSCGLVSPGALPAGVHLLTLKWLSCGRLLLRLSHMHQAGEAADGRPPTAAAGADAGGAVAGTVALDLHRLLKLRMLRVEEATLFGERALAPADTQGHAAAGNNSSSSLLTVWRPPLLRAPPRERPFSFRANRLSGPIPAGTLVSLHPMQIRSFYVSVARADSECTDAPPPVRRVARSSAAETDEWRGGPDSGAAGGASAAAAAAAARSSSWLLPGALLLAAAVSVGLGVAALLQHGGGGGGGAQSRLQLPAVVRSAYQRVG